MTSKQRVLAALGHTQPDRVPCHIRLAPELAEKLQQHLGLDESGLEDWLHPDVVRAVPRFPNAASEIRYADPTIEVTDDGLFLDVFRVPFRQVTTELQTYVELAGLPPLRDCQSLDELAAFDWPTADMWDYSTVKDQVLATDKAAYGHSRGFFEIAHFLRGMDAFLMDLALNEDFACALMDHIADYLLEKSRRILEAGEGNLVLFEYNDDVACQRGLFISPDMWRRLIKPRMARFCDLAHSHGARVKYHSCGSVRKIIPDLIEIGVDLLNPVQPLAAGMAPFELKKLFGDRLAFDGGIDIQELLPNASPAQVRDHVRRMIDVVGREGGYILGGSHTIQADVPVENIIAMVEEAGR